MRDKDYEKRNDQLATAGLTSRGAPLHLLLAYCVRVRDHGTCLVRALAKGSAAGCWHSR